MFGTAHLGWKYLELTINIYVKTFRMAGRSAIENVKRNSDQAKLIIQELKSEV